MSDRNAERVIRVEKLVDGSLWEVWDAWTTEEGIRSFFAPACNIELRVGGPYEMFFDPNAEPGSRGGEGVTILSIQEDKMLSFTWNAPPHLANVRQHFTHVVIRFEEISESQTMVSVSHDGWGEGEEWDRAYNYFTRAWKDVVMPRLVYRFSVGRVNWNDPPSWN
jgi:uncharacterized protein YndB with AHSA1/START domain